MYRYVRQRQAQTLAWHDFSIWNNPTDFIGGAHLLCWADWVPWSRTHTDTWTISGNTTPITACHDFHSAFIGGGTHV